MHNINNEIHDNPSNGSRCTRTLTRGQDYNIRLYFLTGVNDFLNKFQNNYVSNVNNLILKMENLRRQTLSEFTH